MKIVVIGGTGLIGTKLVTRLRQKGHEVVAASPASGVNTITGEGLAEALAGAQIVVDLANSPSFEDDAVLKFFETSGRNLLAAEAAGRRKTSRCAVGRRQRPASRERLPARQDGPGTPDQGIRNSIHDRPLHPVLRIRERHRAVGHRRANGSPVARPAAADHVRRRRRRHGRRSRSARRSTARSRSPDRKRCHSTNSSGGFSAPSRIRALSSPTPTRATSAPSLTIDRSRPSARRGSARPVSTTGSAIHRRSDRRSLLWPVARRWPHQTKGNHDNEHRSAKTNMSLDNPHTPVDQVATSWFRRATR